MICMSVQTAVVNAFYDLASGNNTTVPGPLPDLTQYPTLHFFAGLISLVVVVAAAVMYLRGMRIGSDAPVPVPKDAKADPTNTIYWDAILNSIFEALKRIEGSTTAAVLSDATMREHVSTNASQNRHAVISKLQEMVSTQDAQDHTDRIQQEAHRAALRTQLGEIQNALSRIEGRLSVRR